MTPMEYMQELAKKMAAKEMEFLEDESEFVVECVQCGKCCRNREDILLSPFDLYHIVKATGKTVKEVVEKYGDCYVGSTSHMPLVRLRYREEPDGSTTCYFLGRRDGKFICRIHDYKPGVCRTYPLGKVTSFMTDGNEEPSFEPKYFCQEIKPGDNCPGMELAIRGNIRKKVVDWVGGAEKKRLSDRYSAIFQKFVYDYHEVFDYEKIRKHLDERSETAFFSLCGNLIYEAYDFTTDSDDEFLDQMIGNIEKVLGFAKLVAEDPAKFKRMVAEHCTQK